MTDPQDQEPTLRDVLAVIAAARADDAERFEQISHRFDNLDAAVGQLRADVAAIKVDTGYLEAHSRDQQTAILRHSNDPNAHRRAA